MRVVLELARIVRADHVDVAGVVVHELAQSLLVHEARPAVLVHHPLVEAQCRRAARSAEVELVVVEVRVAGEQQPAVRLADGDAGVAERVTEQRHEHDLGRQPLEVAHALEAVPALACHAIVRGPPLVAAPLLGAVALAIERGALAHGILDLGTQHVHGRRGKIVEAAGVVEVEMGQHDVAHVGRAVAQCLDLAHGRQLLAKVRIEQAQEEPREPLRGISYVGEAVARIEQHEATVGLDEHAMARKLAAYVVRAQIHQPAAERARGDAVEVVHAHASTRSKSPASRPQARAKSMKPRVGSVSTSRTRIAVADVEALLAADDATFGGRAQQAHERALVGDAR